MSDFVEAFLKTLPLVAVLGWGAGSVAPDVTFVADSLPLLLGPAAAASAGRCEGRWVLLIGRAMAGEAGPGPVDPSRPTGGMTGADDPPC